MNLLEHVFKAKSYLGKYNGKAPAGDTNFIPDCDLQFNDEMVAQLISLGDQYCKKNYTHISKGKIKFAKSSDRFGDMIGGGWGGARVNSGLKRGYYKYTQELEPFAKSMIQAIPKEVCEQLDFSTSSLLKTNASFVTVNFSHLTQSGHYFSSQKILWFSPLEPGSQLDQPRQG